MWLVAEQGIECGSPGSTRQDFIRMILPLQSQGTSCPLGVGPVGFDRLTRSQRDS